MKKALKKKSVRIQLAIYNIVIFGFLITNIIIVRGFNIPLEYAADYAIMSACIVSLLIAWVAGNAKANSHRRKNKNWAGVLPEEIKEKIWEIRTPWLITACCALLATIIYYIAMG